MQCKKDSKKTYENMIINMLVLLVTQVICIVLVDVVFNGYDLSMLHLLLGD